jgi:hypothetical protein
VDNIVFEISSSHGGEFEVRICLLGCAATALMMEAAHTSETPVDNYFHSSASQKTNPNIVFIYGCL